MKMIVPFQTVPVPFKASATVFTRELPAPRPALGQVATSAAVIVIGTGIGSEKTATIVLSSVSGECVYGLTVEIAVFKSFGSAQYKKVVLG